MTTALDVINVARSQIGTKEDPIGSNRTKYGAEFGYNGVPWCAIFVWWTFNHAGMPLPVKTAGCATLVGDFQKRKQFSKLPQPGAVGFCGSHGEDHTFFVESVDPDGMGFTTIEGNSDPSGSYNGTVVCRRKRRVGDGRVYGFGIPAYSTPQPSPAVAPVVAAAVAEEDEEMKLVVVWNDGSKISVNVKGEVFTGSAPYFGSIPELKPEQRQGFEYAALAEAVDVNNKHAGYVIFNQKGQRFTFTEQAYTAIRAGK